MSDECAEGGVPAAESSKTKRQRAIWAKALSAINPEDVASLNARFAADKALHGGLHGLKYLEIEPYIRDKSRWIMELDLDRTSGLRILDLGVGGGHFPFIAQCYGHEVLGIDLQHDVYEALLGMYGIRRIVQTVRPRQPLAAEGPFDLITGIQLTFNALGRGGEGRRFWSEEDWVWFLKDASSRLAFPGRLFFALNRQPLDDGSDRAHVDDLMAMFERKGARVDWNRYSVLFELSKPFGT